MQVWRIFRERFRSTAFTGVGGTYVAGRWNHQGTAMVYAATSRALAALEFFVNLDVRDASDDLMIAEATVPDELVEKLDLTVLPSDWGKLNSLACRDAGSGWAESGWSLALEVPSAVVEGDWNVLLNPAHPEFGKVKLAEPKSFRFDPRMFR